MEKITIVVLVLFVGARLCAQTLHIDSLSVEVNGPTASMTIFGKFGESTGTAWIGATSLAVRSWTDSSIVTDFPTFNNDGGPCGEVHVQEDTSASNGRFFSGGLYAAWYHYITDSIHVSRIEGLWHYDLHSFFLNHKDNGATLLMPRYIFGGGQASFYFDFNAYTADLLFGGTPRQYILLDSDYRMLPNGGYYDGSYQVEFSATENCPPPMTAVAIFKGVSLILPLNNSYQPDTTSVAFQWQSSPYFDRYHLRIATDSQMSVPTMDTIVIAQQLRGSSFSSNTSYYWRVAGINAEGESRWSPVWHFTTSADPEEVQNRVALEGFVCSPNPAASTIHLTLPEATDGAEIILYDLTGRVLQRHLLNGESTFDLAVANLTNGVYAVTLVSAQSRETRLITISH